MDVPTINIETPKTGLYVRRNQKSTLSAQRPGYPATRYQRGEITRHKLMLSAIELAGRQGFSNVPLRSIVDHSQSGNISAINYHFKDREGLLRTTIAAIEAAWPADLPVTANGNVRSILTWFLLNLTRLQGMDDWQNSILRFITRLCVDDDPACRKAAEALLAPRLFSVYRAVEGT